MAFKNSTAEVFFRPTRKDFSIQWSAQVAGLYQAPYREPLMGSDRWPVHYSDVVHDSEGFLSHQSLEGAHSWSGLEAQWMPTTWLGLSGKISSGRSWRANNFWWQVDELYSDIRINKLVLSLGRKPLLWGQNGTGSFLQSLNARNLDLIELTNSPVILPSFLRYLGPVKADFFFSRLDDERVPANDFFSGWRLGFKPSKNFEMNISGVYQWGGDSIASESWYHALVEYFGGRVQTGSTNLDTSNFFNRAGLLDWRLTFSDWKYPTSFYSENHLEDCCGNPFFLLKKAVSYSYGAHVLSSHDPDPWRFRLEYLKTGNAIYYHQTWPSGATNAGRLMGHDMGRDAQEVYFEMAKNLARFNVDCRLYGFWRERLRTGRLSTVSEVPDVNAHDLIPYFSESEKTSAIGFNMKWVWSKSLIFDAGGLIDYVFNKEGRGGLNRLEGGFQTGFSALF
jgi:hypothetical protein